MGDLENGRCIASYPHLPLPYTQVYFIFTAPHTVPDSSMHSVYEWVGGWMDGWPFLEVQTAALPDHVG